MPSRGFCTEGLVLVYFSTISCLSSQSTVTEMLKEKLQEHMDAKVILLNGFPRDKAQVDALNKQVSQARAREGARRSCR